MPEPRKERHRTQRIGWLRAAVLGANDGVVSTASLVLGVATSHAIPVFQFACVHTNLDG
jgi:VIT1/CCC1 family predicted Fe2+/Mn2+ transporter